MLLFVNYSGGMVKEVWADAISGDATKVIELAKKLKLTGVYGVDSADTLKGLPKKNVVDLGVLRSQKDIEDIVERYRLGDGDKVPYVIAAFPKGEERVPVENLIARKGETRVLIRTADVADIGTYGSALQLGVDGFIVTDYAKLGDFASILKPYPILNLVDAKITDILTPDDFAKKVGGEAPKGDRVCVDLTVNLSPGKGLLMGFGTAPESLLALVDSESHREDVKMGRWVNTRPFRVNAGFTYAYTLTDIPMRTAYLHELEAGFVAMPVDYYGRTEKAIVGRTKTELRPFRLIKYELGGIEGKSFLQDAETVRLVSSKDSQIRVTEIKKGDTIKAYHAVGGMHFGTRVSKMEVFEQ